MLIEYDGGFHFTKTTIVDFDKVKKHDSIKNLYCAKNNIRLLRIPYWEFLNIENILNTELFDNGICLP